jgi:hypothetical protein
MDSSLMMAILGGYNQAQQEDTEKKQKEESSIRKNLLDYWTQQAQDPTTRPWAAEEYRKRIQQLVTLSPTKKRPKEWEQDVKLAGPPQIRSTPEDTEHIPSMAETSTHFTPEEITQKKLSELQQTEAVKFPYQAMLAGIKKPGTKTQPRNVTLASGETVSADYDPIEHKYYRNNKDISDQVTRLGDEPKEKFDLKHMAFDEWMGKPENKGKGALEFLNSLANQGTELTPEAIDIAAHRYALTGDMGTWGFAAKGVRTQIANRAAQLYPKVDIATNAAAYQANKTTLSNISKIRDQVLAFESTAKKNLLLFKNAADKVIDTGSAWLNQPLRAVEEKGLNASEITAYRTARNVALTEVARVISTASATGVLTNEQINEVKGLIGEGASLASVYSAVNILMQDMANRKESLTDQANDIRQRIGTGSTTETKSSIQPPALPPVAKPKPVSKKASAADFDK